MNTLTKASVYLRPVGSASASSNIISSSSGVSIEGGNIYRISQGNPNIVFSNSESDFFGKGYMEVGVAGSGDVEWGYFSYPIKAERADKYSLFLRIRRLTPNTGPFSFEVLLDGESVGTFSPASSDSWVWESIDITIPDTLEHELSIRILSENTLLNCMHIGKTLPATVEFDAPYVTIHFKAYEIDEDMQPSATMPVYGFKTTLDHIKSDDWYNYSLAPLPGNGSISFNIRYSVALLGVGSSASHHVVWDYSSDDALDLDPYNPLCALVYDADAQAWSTICNRKYSLRLYSFQDSLDESGCAMVTPAADLDVLNVRKFDVDAYQPSFLYTGIVSTGGDTNKVQLQLPDRIVSILVDQSGSTTWNDSAGLRHALAQRLVTRVDATYPGEVTWNVFSFEGTPIRLNFFAVVESSDLDTTNVEAAASAYFSDQESGYAGVRVIRKAGSFPETPVDGEIVSEGFFDRAFDEDLAEGQEYFYKVFTFDSHGTYSRGVEMQVTPRERNIPLGVSPFTANVLLGSGVRLDSNVIASWHLDEGSGGVAYDFSSNQIHAVSNGSPVWLNASDVPSGRSGLRIGQNADNAFRAQDTAGVIGSQSQYTVMFWLYPLDTAGHRAYLSIEDNSVTKANIGIQNGKVAFTNDFSNYALSASSIDPLAWTHVGITVNEATGSVGIYINGDLSSTTVLPTPGSVTTPYVTIGDAINATPSPGFGKITEVSFHDIIRSSAYILQQSVQPETLEDKILDNGDRLLLLNYSVPSGANYLHGNVRVVEKVAAGEARYTYSGDVDTSGTPDRKFDGFGLPPFHPNDGDIIYDNAVHTPGQYSFTVSDAFVHGREYHFKAFSQNLSGNFSDWSDSPVLSIKIPAFSSSPIQNADRRRDAIVAPSLPPVGGIAVRPGNQKNYLQWTAPASSDVAQVQVYYSAVKPPIFSPEGTVTEAELIFSGSPDQTSFVHRSIQNNANAYYALVTADRYGYVSTPSYVNSAPSLDADEVGIPLLEISKLRYELVDDTSISIGWEQPVRFQKSVKAYFDQRVAIFAQITDEFGAPIADDSRIKFVAKGEISSAENAEDVFSDNANLTATLPIAEDTYLLSSVPQGSGLIKGILRMTSDFDVLSAINDLRVAVNVFFSIPDRNDPTKNIFEYNSLPITIEMSNPFKMELINQSGDTIAHLCKKEVPLESAEFMSSGGEGFDPNLEQDFNGTFIRRNRPFVGRVKVSYRGAALGIGNQAFVSVKQASDPQCNNPDSDQIFTPSFSLDNSTTVQPPATTLLLLSGTETTDSGVVDSFSYVDIPLTPPRTPQAVMLFAQVAYNGFSSRKKMYVVFENILRVEVTINEPAPDCIEQAEQFSAVYLIDPNSPNPALPSKVQIPDNQICRWNMRKGITGKNRPFFSLDNVSAGPGVYSYVRGGTARRVFFGPACGVTWQIVNLGPNRGGPALLPEFYAIRASVVYDGLVAFEERPMTIYPGAGPNTFGDRFLMNFGDIVNTLWADGYDYQRLTVYRDPNTAGGVFGESFRTCAEDLGGNLFILNKGQIVEIEAQDDFEIIHGESLQIDLDPYIDEFVFSNATTDVALATIPLDIGDDETHAYFKINKFIGPPSPPPTDDNGNPPAPIQNRCSAITIPLGVKEEPDDKIISGRTTVVINGETRYLSAGGTFKNGIPPTVLRLKEPLSIRIVDARVNDVPVQKLVVDGSTEHTFTVEVSFSGKPVPNGTPIKLTVGGANPSKVQLRDALIYTSQREDPYLMDGVKSYAEISILPMNPAESFSAKIDAETNYDKRGSVTRKMTACISISYDSQQQDVIVEDDDKGQVNNVFSNALLVYSVSDNDWTAKTTMEYARGGLTLSYANNGSEDVLYAIGGLGDSAVTAYNEQYSIADNAWTEKEPMLTPRFNHATVVYGGNIYVFGGFVVENNELSITSVVEKYNPTSDTWTSLSSMPSIDSTPYGLAMANCIVVGDYAYLLSGIRSISVEGIITGLNERVLVYSFLTDTWSYGDALTGIMLDSYRRVAPFCFYDSTTSKIRVVGGAHVVTSEGQQSLEFATDAYAVDVVSPSSPDVSLSDNAFDSLPAFRYKGGSVHIPPKAYFLGGANANSDTLKFMESCTTAATSTYAKLANAPVALQSFGIAAKEVAMTNEIYVAGGITSGRPPGFAQIKASVTPSTIRLDGRQTAGIDIELIDETGNHIESPIRVLVRGYLLFSEDAASEGSSGSDQGQQSSADSVNRQSLVYPVIFSSNDFVISNGIGTTTLLPRSDDILRKISDIKEQLGITDAVVGEAEEADVFVIEEGKVRTPYSISIQITIVDDFYYGQTVVSITDNDNPDQSPTNNPADANTPTTPVGSSSSGGGNRCRAYSASKAVSTTEPTDTATGGSGTAISQGLAAKSVAFSLNPPQKPQLPSPKVGYYCDIDWLPQVVSHLSSNDATADQALSTIARLKNSIPFGGSPLYDGLSKISEALIEDSGRDLSKIIYVNTDNEENLSVTTVDDAIEEIQAIDGFGRTPVIVNNFSVVFPVTLSALVARTDTQSLERLADETGGQSQTVLEAMFLDEVLNNAIGRVNGSIGWGTYEAVIDLGTSAVIRSASLSFELFSNTTGNWSISVSDDGFVFGEESDIYDATDTASFSNVMGRYLKFKVTLLSGLSASTQDGYDAVATPGAPSLTGINIDYGIPAESIIFVNSEQPESSAQQIAVGLRSNEPTGATIEIGAATSETTNWADYHSGSQPAVGRAGKVFIPIRTQQTDASLNEPLINIDGFVWKTKYGSWNNESNVIIRDSDGDIIEESSYKTFPRQGIVTFAEKQTGSLFIDIENAATTKMAIRIVNRDSENPVIIEGFGYFYNTNVFLPPPLAQRPPEVSALVIVPSDPSVYAKVSAGYKYYDINNDAEDTSQTEIRWFINGVETQFLRNLRSWNDISDTNDPLWLYAFSFAPSDVPSGTSAEEFARQKKQSLVKVGDVIYFTVRPNDGNGFGPIVRSPSVTVSSSPPSVTGLTIRGRLSSGATQDTITTATTAFADYILVSDDSDSALAADASIVIWFVNNVEFKRGAAGGSTNGIKNDELAPGELKPGTGTRAIAIGSVLSVEVRPASQQSLGTPVTSASKTVQNSPPTAVNVLVSPASPTSSSDLQVSYDFVDADVSTGAATQSNQSSIRWFRQRSGQTSFEEVTSAANKDIVLRTLTASGDRWYAQVIPFDGLSVGTMVQSNTVRIS